MAKLKTFTDLSVLTASDVNNYLNPDVPSGASVYDTGWVTTGFTMQAAVTAGPSAAYIRRVGLWVQFYVDGLTVSIPSIDVRGNCTNTNIFTVPSGFAPSRSQGGFGGTATGIGSPGCYITAAGMVVCAAVMPDATQTATVAGPTALSMGVTGSYLLG